MPINPKSSQANNSKEMQQAILSGNYQNYLEITDFSNFFTYLFNETTCNGQVDSDPNCTIHLHQPINNQVTLKTLIDEDSLKHVWNFCSKFIVSQAYFISQDNDNSILNATTATVQQLLKLQADFSSLYSSKISNTNYLFTENDSSTINSYYEFIKEFFQIPKIEYFNGQTAYRNSKLLLKSILSFAPNQTQSDLNLTSRYCYDIESPFQNFMTGSGRLALQLRSKEEPYDFLEISAIELKNVSVSKLKSVDLKRIMYAFVSEYHHGYEDIENTCQQLFNIKDCYPYNSTVNQEFQSIAQNLHVTHSVTSSKILEQLLWGTRESIIQRLKTLSTTTNKNNPLSNFLNYFEDNIKQANQQNTPLSYDFVDKLFNLSIRLSELFKAILLKPQLVNQSLSLILTLFKHFSIKQHENNLWYAIDACANQVKTLFTNNNTLDNKDLTKSLAIFSEILDFATNYDSIITSYNQRINSIVYDLSLKCLNINVCDHFVVLNLFSKNLGIIGHKLINNKHASANSTLKVERDIIKAVANNNNITENQLKGLAWTFLNHYHAGNQSKITSTCSAMFNLSECKNFAITESPELETNTSFTLVPEIVIHRTTTNPFAAKTIPNVLPLPPNQSVIPFNNITEANLTTTALPVNISNTSSNQTAVDTANTQNLDALSLGSPLALGASTAHGVGNGLLNGVIQYFATKYSRHGDQSSTARAIAIYSSLLMPALFSATFPLMLFKIQEQLNQGNEDEAQQLWDNLLLQVFPTFISSASFSLCLHAGYEFTRLCFNRFHAVAQNTVPFLGTAYNLYHKPLETSVQLSASIATSSLTYFGLNRLSPIKYRQSSDIETAHTKVKYNVQNDDVEVQPLNPEKYNYTLTTSVTEENLTPEEIFFKKVEFLTADQYKKLKNYLNTLVTSIKKLQDELSDQTHIDRLDQILNIPQSKLGLHYDLLDLENFPLKFIKEYNECHDDKQKTQVIKNNFDYFKTMIKTMYDKLLSDNVNIDCLNFILCSIKETKTLKTKITDLIKSIEENLGFIRGITKPLVSIHLPQQLSLEHLPKKGPGVLSRQDTGITHVNNRYSIHGLNNNVTRLSIASSGDSSDSAHSDGYGNTKFNDSKIQEEQGLLQTRLNR